MGLFKGDLKTTISGLVGAVAMVLRLLGIGIPDIVCDGIVAVAVFLIGLFAKDKT